MSACLQLGSYCPLGSPAPIPCPSGRFGNGSLLVSKDQCTACHPGSHCPTGSDSPLLCSFGSFQDAFGRPECKFCSPGHYQSAMGSLGCDICPNQTYATNFGSVECNNCLSRLSSYPGAKSCGICDKGFFRLDDQTNATQEACEPCFEKGAMCPKDTSLERVVVLPGFWRLSNRSREMTKCAGTSSERRCKGGMHAGMDGDGYCSERYTGPECLLCRGKGLYKKEDECVACPNFISKLIALVGYIVAFVLVLGGGYVAILHPLGGKVRFLRRPRRAVAWIQTYVAILDLSVKGKILFSFLGIIQTLNSTYGARLPEEFERVVDSVFGWASPDKWMASLLLPSECTPIASTGSSFRSWLLFKALSPLLVILIAVLWAIGAECRKFGFGKQGLYSGVLNAMPLALVTSFLFVPSVSKNIFRSFLCVRYQFDGRDIMAASSYSYLHYDVNVRCSENGYIDAEHDTIKSIATMLIFVWPVGMVALYLFALLPCRTAIQQHHQTNLVRATKFLHRDYAANCFYWELVELMRRTILMGWVLLIPTEISFIRLMVALLLSITSLVLLLSIRPYRKQVDTMYAAGCQLVLISSFIGAILIRLFEGFSSYLPAAVVEREMVFSSSMVIALPLLVLTVAMAAAMLVIVFSIIQNEGHQPTIHLVATGMPPELTLIQGHLWHLFLSHIWSTGQAHHQPCPREGRCVTWAIPAQSTLALESAPAPVHLHHLRTYTYTYP